VELWEHTVQGVNDDAAPLDGDVDDAASPPPKWASARTWEGAPSESAALGELETARPSAVVVPEHRRSEPETFVAVVETAAAVDAQP